MKRLVRNALIGVISIVILAILAVSAVLVWGSWVSPFERRAIRGALDRIDEVSEYNGSDPAEYEKKVEAARKAIAVSEHKAVTAYDKQLQLLLGLQLDGAQAEHKARIKAATDVRYARMFVAVRDTNRQTEAMLREHVQ